ncbi:acyl carrier protein [Streptomyces sp. NPDC059639]|uniref:acyl carrier protein n=1 Tax=Streptomyces sp. NPDC059639 TaxID=3346891 RepID=UPI00368BA298
MPLLTLDDLRRILIDSAGEEDGVDLAGDILDTRFTDLGYDSLALMESVSRIERDLGLDLDEMATEADTPRALLELVNGPVAEAA